MADEQDRGNGPGQRAAGAPAKRRPGRPVDPAARERRTAAILAAAARCFARDGFWKASMGDICREAGTSPGNLYQYFESKDDIVLAMAETERQSVLALLRTWRDAADLPATLEAHVAEAFRTADSGQREQARLGVEVLAEAGRNPRIAAAFRRLDVDLTAALAEAIRHAQAVGTVDAAVPPESTAIALLGLYDGLVGRLVVEASGPDEAEPGQALIAAARYALSALLPRPSGTADT